MKERPPQKCCKCGEACRLVYDWQTDPDALSGPPGWEHHNPWRKAFADGQEIENVVYGCPTHGELHVLPDGRQWFIEPDTWVEGPNGERLFRI